MKTKIICLCLCLGFICSVRVFAQTTVCPGESILLSLGGSASGASIQWQSSLNGLNFTNIVGATTDNYSLPVAATAYYRAIVVLGNCDRVFSDTQFVALNPALVVNAGAPSILCAGAGVALGGAPTASGGLAPYHYAWSPSAGLNNDSTSNPTTNPTVTTTYNVSVTDSLGCTAADSVTVTVNPSPVADAGASQTLFCSSAIIGGSPTGSGGTGTLTFNWSPATGLSSSSAPNPTASPSTTTLYTVTITDANGCAATDTVTVAVASSQTFGFTGAIQNFVVPPCVSVVTIVAKGGQGGTGGGLGASIQGTFSVTPGETLRVVVGEEGHAQLGGDVQNSSGGGGGTFVHTPSGTLWIAAGGGGGICNWTASAPLHAGAAGQITTSGGASSDGNPGGTGGNGGPEGYFFIDPSAGGGAGWLSAGGSIYGGNTQPTWSGGLGYCGGGGGGCGGVGGFGGGGGGGNNYGGGGGGGGYSGGAGGTDPTHGGGGGSFNGGTSQVNVAGVNVGNGSVVFSW